MVYFVDRDIPRGVNFDEVRKVDEFKAEYGSKGVYAKYDVGRIAQHLYRKISDYKREKVMNESMQNNTSTETQPTDFQVDTQQTNTNKEFPFEELIMSDTFTVRELLVFRYIIETGNRLFGFSWKRNETIQKIKDWENSNFLSSDLWDNYNETIANLEEWELIEPIEYTEYSNVKLYSMPLPIFNQLRMLPDVVKTKIFKNVDNAYVDLPF